MTKMNIEDIVKRRAIMDCQLDVRSLKHFELWGEEEIKNCVDEILEKIKTTLTLFEKMSDDKTLKIQINKVLEEFKEEKNIVLHYVKIWQEQYRLEKMFYILSKEDRRNEVE